MYRYLDIFIRIPIRPQPESSPVSPIAAAAAGRANPTWQLGFKQRKSRVYSEISTRSSAWRAARAGSCGSAAPGGILLVFPTLPAGTSRIRVPNFCPSNGSVPASRGRWSPRKGEPRLPSPYLTFPGQKQNFGVSSPVGAAGRGSSLSIRAPIGAVGFHGQMAAFSQSLQMCTHRV